MMTVMDGVQPLLMVASAGLIAVRFRGSTLGVLAPAGIVVLIVASTVMTHDGGGELVATTALWRGVAKNVGHVLLLIAFAKYVVVPSPAGGSVAGHADEHVSKAKFLGAFVGGALAPLVALSVILIPTLGGRPSGPAGGPAVAAFGAAALIGPLVSVIALLMLVHRMWTALDGHPRRMSPTLAVWGHFVPVLHLYFAFQAWSGWALDYNRAAAKMASNPVRIPVLLPMLISVFSIGLMAAYGVAPSAFPTGDTTSGTALRMFGIAVASGTIGLIAVFVSVACDGINALANAAVSPADNAVSKVATR